MCVVHYMGATVSLTLFFSSLLSLEFIIFNLAKSGNFFFYFPSQRNLFFLLTIICPIFFCRIVFLYMTYQKKGWDRNVQQQKINIFRQHLSKSTFTVLSHSLSFMVRKTINIVVLFLILVYIWLGWRIILWWMMKTCYTCILTSTIQELGDLLSPSMGKCKGGGSVPSCGRKCLQYHGRKDAF